MDPNAWESPKLMRDRAYERYYADLALMSFIFHARIFDGWLAARLAGHAL